MGPNKPFQMGHVPICSGELSARFAGGSDGAQPSRTCGMRRGGPQMSAEGRGEVSPVAIPAAAAGVCVALGAAAWVGARSAAAAVTIGAEAADPKVPAKSTGQSTCSQHNLPKSL